MKLEKIIQSKYSNATKARMLLNYLDTIKKKELSSKVYHYYRCYEALAIIQILEQECQRVDESLADVYLFRLPHFTAWIREDIIYQWDDTNADDFLEKPESFPCCIDKRFNRWWVYPKKLLSQQTDSNPITMPEILNLETYPMLVSAAFLLNCLELGLNFTSEVSQFIWFRSKEE